MNVEQMARRKVDRINETKNCNEDNNVCTQL